MSEGGLLQSCLHSSEAGDDVDFHFRSIAGIDSIVQSAGRCNREGNYQWTTYVFNLFQYAKIKDI